MSMHESSLHLVFIGAQKAASSWVQAALHASPGYWYPPQRGELAELFGDDEAASIEAYCKLYEGAPTDSITVDVTPLYLDDMRMPQRFRTVQATLGRRLKFIAVLREPTDRLLSAYQMAVRKNGRRSLADTLEARPELVRRGLYGSHLRVWFDLWDRDDFVIAYFDKVISNNQHFLRELRTALGPNAPDISNAYAGKRVNPGGLARVPELDRLFRMGGTTLRAAGLDSLLHRLKSSKAVTYLRESNRKQFELSVSDETLLAESRRTLFEEDVKLLANIINDPSLPRQWGY